MAFGVTITPSQFRYDGLVPPAINVTDRSTYCYVKMADWQYFGISDDDIVLLPPNRTMAEVPVKVRNLLDPTWVLDTGISKGSGGLFTRSAVGNSFLGGYYNTALDPANCSVQAGVTSDDPCGISLQNGSTISHDYTALDEVQHAIYLGPYGQGRIYENGSLVSANPYFKYEFGDRVMIELINGIVRYFLIDADNNMTLLRTTRSKLTEAPKAEVMLYTSAAALTGVFVHNNTEVSASFEMVGVLENFQDWMNDHAIASTADAIQMADNNQQFTFPNHKTRLRTLQANLAMRPKEQRDAFVEFFNYHGIEKEFLFVDLAHTDENREAVEWWAKFASPFGDKARASCLSVHNALITEDYRNDYVPKIVDAVTPAAPVLSFYAVGGDAHLEWDFVTGSVAYYEYEWSLDTIDFFPGSDPPNPISNLTNAILVTFPGAGINLFYRVRAIGYGGLIGPWSNIIEAN